MPSSPLRVRWARKLLYPDHTLQHAGIVVGIDNGAGHAYKHFPADHRGYFLRLSLTHNVSALTGRC